LVGPSSGRCLSLVEGSMAGGLEAAGAIVDAD
jgi:hypothetical protein